jgi:hypothetical protein
VVLVCSAPPEIEAANLGKVYQTRLRARSIDQYVFGMTAIGTSERESVVSAFDWQAVGAWRKGATRAAKRELASWKF